MPRERESITHKFSIGMHEGYITAGKYEDGSLGEIFLTDIGKEGSTIKGLMNAFATAISIGLQYGVPLEDFVKKFSYMRFEPEGITRNPEIPFAKSMPDYIMRWLASRFIDDVDYLESLGIMTDEVRARKEAQQALPIEEGNGGATERNGHVEGGEGNGHSNGEAKAESGRSHRPRSKPPTAALTDTPPVHPAAIEGLELGPACDQCGGDDAAHRQLLHLLELRQQHRLRLSCRRPELTAPWSSAGRQSSGPRAAEPGLGARSASSSSTCGVRRPLRRARDPVGAPALGEVADAGAGEARWKGAPPCQQLGGGAAERAPRSARSGLPSRPSGPRRPKWARVWTPSPPRRVTLGPPPPVMAARRFRRTRGRVVGAVDAPVRAPAAHPAPRSNRWGGAPRDRTGPWK